ncbi:hypothetical protein O3P69_007589 [Scylla paramamosain]|uniref:Uncharacterized protein n=1 Tax=Scylla paramamosain TaxID=85552 RepID=A0AAW0UWH4_SCYPA
MASSSRGIQIGSAWFQRKIKLRPQHRGIHLVTDEVLKEIPELRQFSVGLLHVQILHTSASLALNENWDPYVRDDMEMMLNKIVPEGMPYRHSCEGPDDMPAHVKACFIGSSLTLPISEGKLNLGTWQGIWLCEHRNDAGPRKIVATINGCLRDGRTPVSPMNATGQRRRPAEAPLLFVSLLGEHSEALPTTPQPTPRPGAPAPSHGHPQDVLLGDPPKKIQSHESFETEVREPHTADCSDTQHINRDGSSRVLYQVHPPAS